MAKQKRKLTAQEKAAKKLRRLEFMTIFINGKQKRVKRPATIDGIPADEFILLNADPAWLLQNGEYQYIEMESNYNSSDITKGTGVISNEKYFKYLSAIPNE